MRVGSLRDLITIQRRKLDKDSRGETTEDWADHAQAWAHVMQNDGRDRVEGMQKVTTYSHRIKIRYRDDLRTTDQIVLAEPEGNRTLKILSIVDKHRRRQYLELVCMEHER